MKNLLTLIIKEKKIVLTFLLSAFVIFLFYFIFIYKPLYSSSAKIFIKDIPQQNIIAQFGGGSVVKSESGYSNPLFNIAQVLKSKNTSIRVMDALKQKQEDDFNKLKIKNEDEWHKFLSKHITTKIIPSTDTLALSLNWTNKNTTTATLNEIIEQFKAENMDMRKAVAVNQRKFLETNLQEISNKLTDVRKELRNYTIQNNAVNMDVEKAILVEARVKMQRDIELTKSKISYFDKKYKELSNHLGISDVRVAIKAASIGQDPYLDNLFTNLALSQQKLADLSSIFTESYPKVIAAQNEIDTLNKLIKERQNEHFQNIKGLNETPAVIGLYDESSQDIVTDMAMAKAETVSLTNQLNEMEKGVNNLLKRESSLPEKILGLEELLQQEAALKTAYENVKTKQLEAKLNENSIVNNIFILDTPSKPVFIFTDLLFKFLGFLYLGLIGGIATAWAKDYLESKIKDNEVESFAV